MADRNLRATQGQLCDALSACTELKPIYRRLLEMFLEELQFIDQQISQLTKSWPIWSAGTTMRSPIWRRYPASASIQRNKSLPR